MSDTQDDTPQNNSRDNQESNQKNSDRKKYSLLAIAATLLIGAYFFGRSIQVDTVYNNQAVANTQKLQQGENVQQDSLKLFPSDQIFGNPSEKPAVTIIEYGSLTCPHCADFHNNILSMVKHDYIDSQKVQYIYRDYPLDGIALRASLLARCDLSKRQAFLNLLYKKQTEWTKGSVIEDIEKNLLTIGKMGGLSAEKITECLKDKELTDTILDVQTQSSKLFKIEATPTIIINNQKFAGGLKADALKNILDNLLAKKSKSDSTTSQN